MNTADISRLFTAWGRRATASSSASEHNRRHHGLPARRDPIRNPQSAIPRSGLAWILFRALLLIPLLGAAACRPVETRFEVVSFRDRIHPETLTQRFEPGSFCRNMGQVYEIAIELPEAAHPPETRDDDDSPRVEAQADPPPTSSTARPALTAQIIKIDVFWRPMPGTTYAERTQTNAAIRYVLRTGEEAISYEGAGFVYFDLSSDGTSLEGEIESSTLRPTRHTAGGLDIFGPCRLTGAFTAVQDRRGVAGATQKINRWLNPADRPRHRPHPDSSVMSSDDG